MNEEIKKLFPMEFKIGKNKSLYAEVYLENLNKIIAHIEHLQQRVEQLEKENQKLKKAVKEKVIATCNTCEDYGICPHSYREYDLENIRKEAIKLIKEDACYDEDWNRCCDDLSLSVCDEVLNILNKGSE